MFLPSRAARAAGDDGIVRIKSAYSMPETIKRLKKDVADKGIMFFDEIDQSKLAADAGVTLRPSTLLVFGNPPLGTLFLTSNPAAGLDWPVRLLSIRMRRVMSGFCTRISPGSLTGTESWIATKPSRRHRT
jgi:uncharacterized protein (DUF302 family)